MSPRESFSRADLFNFFGALIQGGFVYSLITDLGFAVPDDSGERPKSAFRPGWIESQIPDRGPFIKAQASGHADYLRNMATHPLLRKVFHLAFTDLVKPRVKKQKRPTLQETITAHVGYAARSLQQMYGYASVSDVTHVMFMSLAGVHSNFFSNGDVRHQFGAPIDFKHDDRSRFTIAPYEHNIPVVVKGDGSRGFDYDKMMHFSNFAFLTHQFWYANEYNLPEAREIPNFARIYTSFGSTPLEKAKRLAMLGQYMWETYETKRWIDGMVQQGEYVEPVTGFADADMGGDFDSNRFGIAYACALADKNLTVSKLADSIGMLGQKESLITATGF